MKKLLIIAILGSILVSTTSLAEPATSEKQAEAATKFRQSVLQLVKSNVGALGGMAKGVIPMDAEKIQLNTMRIEQLSLMMDDYFSVDTREFDVDTEAQPKIWDNYSDFQSKIKNLTAAAQDLNKTAKAGDESSFKAKIGDLLKSCKGCHDEYKEE